ncbi:hypothetical protein DEO72_LG6g1539 [Vigna unguiculata]|uniref:Uncharacterized protein n=1 Tax=Vigna unguiculata TaxID=3917 RepID=A0A4D6M612_VIGUN|nr:hypothetical protein DEO72_LG6g1539 [Vigna unguiculata]
MHVNQYSATSSSSSSLKPWQPTLTTTMAATTPPPPSLHCTTRTPSFSHRQPWMCILHAFAPVRSIPPPSSILLDGETQQPPQCATIFSAVTPAPWQFYNNSSGSATPPRKHREFISAPSHSSENKLTQPPSMAAPLHLHLDRTSDAHRSLTTPLRATSQQQYSSESTMVATAIALRHNP